MIDPSRLLVLVNVLKCLIMYAIQVIQLSWFITEASYTTSHLVNRFWTTHIFSLNIFRCCLLLISSAFHLGMTFDAFFTNNDLQIVWNVVFDSVQYGFLVYQFIVFNQYATCWGDMGRWLVSLPANETTDGLLDSKCYNTESIKVRFPNSTEAIQEMVRLSEPINWICIAFLVVTCILLLLFCFSCYVSFEAFTVNRWTIYELMGASKKPQKILRRYHRYILFAKFNVFSSIMSAILGGVANPVFVGLLMYGFKSDSILDMWYSFPPTAKVSHAAASLLAVVAFINGIVLFKTCIRAIRGGKKVMLRWIILSYSLQAVLSSIVTVADIVMFAKAQIPEASEVEYELIAFGYFEFVMNVCVLYSLCVVFWDFKNEIPQIVSSLEEYHPSLFKPRPIRLKPSPERMVLD